MTDVRVGDWIKYRNGGWFRWLHGYRMRLAEVMEVDAFDKEVWTTTKEWVSVETIEEVRHAGGTGE